MVGRILEAVHDLVATLAEFTFWRDDWNRTWSPVSYFLAFTTLIALLALIYCCGREIWAYFSGTP